MKVSSGAKIILGLLTALLVISPFLLVVIWFLFIFSFAGVAQSQVQPTTIPYFSGFFGFILVAILYGIVHLGLQVFYIVHIVMNKTGNDVLRSVLGVGMFLFSIIAMPAYYLIYILPENPPQWALNANPGQVQAGPPLEEPQNAARV